MSLDVKPLPGPSDWSFDLIEDYHTVIRQTAARRTRPFSAWLSSGSNRSAVPSGTKLALRVMRAHLLS